MKKIGIITFHNAQNYGAIMQSFALQKFLNQKFDTYVIDYENKNITKNYKILKIRKKNIIGSTIKSIIYLRKNISRKKYYNSFVKKYIKLTQKYKNIKELKEKYPKFDVYITGSDQVWNGNITKGLDDGYTLNFGEKSTKRLSYAASIGDESLIKKDENQYKQKLSLIDKISIREETTKDLLKEFIDKDISVVLDPTLLLEKEIYEDMLKEININAKDDYIFVGDVVPNGEYLEIAQYLSEKTNLKKIYTSEKTKLKNEYINCYNRGPLEFLKYLINGKYIITNSFHVTVFSIIFGKDFWVCPPKNNSARIENLLKKLGIEDRIIYSLEEFKNIDFNKKINFSKVKDNLNMERKKSIDWLMNAIEKE